MPQWPQVSKIILCMAKVIVSEWVSQSVSEWQGHLLSCSGQLKSLFVSNFMFIVATWAQFDQSNSIKTSVTIILVPIQRFSLKQWQGAVWREQNASKIALKANLSNYLQQAWPATDNRSSQVSKLPRKSWTICLCLGALFWSPSQGWDQPFT